MSKNLETVELDEMATVIESDYDAEERYAAMERAAELTAATTLRRSAANARRAEREAARGRMEAAHVVVDAGHALNRDGALGVVSIVEADGAASLVTVSRIGYGVELAPLATLDGDAATIFPVADTTVNRERFATMQRELDAANDAALTSEIGRDDNAGPTAERLAVERMARRFAKTLETRNPVTDVQADTVEHLIAAIRDVAARRVVARKTSDVQVLKLRKTHRAAMAARKDARDERAAATADVLLGKRPRVIDKGEEGALLTAREVAVILGRPINRTERMALQRLARLADGETAKVRGTDTAAHRLANSLTRK